MDRLTKNIAYILLFVFSYINGQNNNTNFNEIVELKTNDNNYLTGEKILFSVYCKNENNNKLSNFSKIAYIDIIDSTKKPVSHLKVFLDKGNANGDFFIPLTFETGVYNIICYTNFMRSFDDFAIISKPILILNPYKETKLLNSETTNPIKIDKEITKTNALKKFNTRSSNIFLFPENLKKTDCVNFLISIRKKDSLDKIVNNSLLENTFHIKGDKNLFPEHRGEIIAGKIKPLKNNFPLSDIPVSLSISGKEFEIKMTTTDKNGNFIFNLDHCIPNPNIQIQVINSKKEDYTIELEKTSQNDYSNISLNNKLYISENLKKTIQQKFIANQIENAYSKFKKDSIIKSTWQPFLILSNPKNMY